MAPHSSTLAWKISWAEEPGRLQSMGSRRFGHDWATLLSLFTFMHWRRKWEPTPVFLPGESWDGGAWWAAVYGVTQSWTRLKRLSSSSSKPATGNIEGGEFKEGNKKKQMTETQVWRHLASGGSRAGRVGVAEEQGVDIGYWLSWTGLERLAELRGQRVCRPP